MFTPQYKVCNKAFSFADRPLPDGHMNDTEEKMNLENSIFLCLIAGFLRLFIHSHYAEKYRKADSPYPGFCCIINYKEGASI